MDLGSKGRTWIGNIYDKFEAVCQEVDKNVKQDTLKYVEGQVQTVGESMKKFYSHVVDDLFPPIVDHVKCEAQSAAVKTDATLNSYIKSVVDVGIDPEEKIEKQTSLDLTVESVKHDDSCGLQSVDQDVTPPLENIHVEPEPNVASGLVENISSNEELDSNVQENAFSALLQEDQLNTFKSLSTESGSNSSLTENHDTLFIAKSEVSMEENDAKDMLPESALLEVKDCIDKEFHESDDNHDRKIDAMGEVCPPLVHRVEAQPQETVRPKQDDFANDTKCVSEISSHVSYSQMALSVTCCEEKAGKRESLSPSCSLKNLCLSEKPTDTSPSKANSAEEPEDACNSLGPVPSSAYLNPDSCRSFQSLQSAEEDASKANETESPVELSHSKHTQFADPAQIKALLSSSFLESSGEETEDISDTEMETIDLNEKAKLDESCVIVDTSELYAVYRRIRKNRSLKKKIQDAFTSKRRLAKEYEQLAILFGDTDFWPEQERSETLSLSSPSKSLDQRNQGTSSTCDSEWELL